MTKWTFCKYAKNGRRRETAVQSGDHAVELLMQHSGWTEYGVLLEFVHSESGLITCIANTEYSTLTFNPNQAKRAPKRVGSRIGIQIKPVSKEPFYFESGGQASSIPLEYVLPIIKVIRAVKQIIENHDFPDGIRWSEPVPGVA